MIETAKLIQKPENPAKKWLFGYPEMLERRERLARHMERYYASATSCTAKLKPVSVSGSPAAYDRMAEAIVNNVDAQRSFAAEIARIDRKAAQVLSAIGQLTDERQKLILTMRYIEGAEWPEIIEHFQRQEDRQSRWVFIQHGRALGIIRRWMEENGVQ